MRMILFDGSQLDQKEIYALAIQVCPGIASVDAVVSFGIDQLTEVFVRLYQGFGIFSGVAEMHVVVSHAVTEQ